MVRLVRVEDPGFYFVIDVFDMDAITPDFHIESLFQNAKLRRCMASAYADCSARTKASPPCSFNLDRLLYLRTSLA
jgi:hypothetical protein